MSSPAISDSDGFTDITATREGIPLPPYTSNGHDITSNDWFVALPQPGHLAKDMTWDTPYSSAQQQNGPFRVRVTEGSLSVIAPIWDVGPWNTADDYWNPIDASRGIYPKMAAYWAKYSEPQIPNLPPNWNESLFPIPPTNIGAGTLDYGEPEAERAFDSSHPYSASSYNYGCDQFGRTIYYTKYHLNGAGIDLADGVFLSGLQLVNNSPVTWEFTTDLPAVKDVQILDIDDNQVFDLQNKISTPLGSGNIFTVVITFTESMQWQNYPIVTAGQDSLHPIFTVTSLDAWSQTTYQNDTWTGTLDLTNTAFALPGQYTMNIVAADLAPNAQRYTRGGVLQIGPYGGNQIDSNGGLNSTGGPASNYQPGIDTRVKFSITPPPQAQLYNANGSLVAQVLPPQTQVCPTSSNGQLQTCSAGLSGSAGLILQTQAAGSSIDQVVLSDSADNVWAEQTYYGQTSATYNLPTLPNGSYTLTVTDIDENETTLNFTVAIPVISLSENVSTTIDYNEVTGDLPGYDSAVAGATYTATAVDPSGAGLTSFNIPTGAINVSCSSLPLRPNTTSAGCTFYLPNPGDFNFTAENALGASSIGWEGVTLNASVSPATSDEFDGSEFDIDMQLDVNSSLGLDEIQSYNTSAPSVVDTRDDTDFSDLPDMKWMSESSSIRDYVITDIEGNQSTLTTSHRSVVGFISQSNGEALDALGNNTDQNINWAFNSTGIVQTIGSAIQNFEGILPSQAATHRYLSYEWIVGSWTDSPSGDVISAPGTLFVQSNGGSTLVTIPSAATSVNLGSIRATAGGYTLGEGTIFLTCGVGLTVQGNVNDVAVPIPVGSALSISIDLQFTPQTIPLSCQCSYFNPDGTCPGGLVTGIIGGFAGGQLFADELDYTSLPGNSIAQVLPGSNLTIPIAANSSISQLNATTAGSFTLQNAQVSTPLGWLDANSGNAYQLTATSTFWSGNFTVTTPLTGTIPSGYSSSDLQVLFYPTSGSGSYQVITPSVSGNNISFNTNTTGSFKIAVTQFQTPYTVSLDGVSIQSNSNQVTLSPASSDVRSPQLLNVLASQGAVPIGPTVVAGPTGLTFNPPALITYAPSASGADATFTQVALNNGNTLNPSNLTYNPTTNTYTGTVSQFSSLFGAFITTTTATLVDLLPPQSTIVIGSASVQGSTQAVVMTNTPISFTALDPPYLNAPVSGAAGTHYLLDAPFVSTTSTPGTFISTSTTLTLLLGTHSLSYYSVDNAGNVEPINISTITVVASASNPFDGLGIAADPSGLLWEVAYASGTVSLTHFSSSTAVLSSTILPAADSSFPWTIALDTGGNPYAIGPALGSNGADLVAVYKATASGAGIISSTTFDSGYSNNNLVFASTQGWIVGAVQTSGPIDSDASGARAYSMAIWKYHSSTGLISLSTVAASRAGFDVATGLAVDGSGHLWIAGYSLEPNPASNMAFDLAVWEFASDGATLLAGPFYRPNYLSDFNTVQLAQILLANGSVYVAAPRGVPDTYTSLGFEVFATTGALLAESAWQPNDGSNAFASSLYVDGSGNIVAAGGEDYGEGATLAGFFRYTSTGALEGAAQLSVGGTRGVAVAGGETWLAVDASTGPALDTGETAFAGAFADIEPPRTSLLINSVPAVSTPVYVSANTSLSFSAIDDAYAAGDEQGVGVQATYYAVDGSSFSAYVSSFSIISQSTHTITFYSVDYAGNVEVVESSSVVVDTTPPTAAFVSSGTLYALTATDPASDGVASGVAGIDYLINVSFADCAGVAISTSSPSGTCANSAYGAPFSLSSGTNLVYYAAYDVAGNFSAKQSTIVVVGTPGPSIPSINLSTAEPSTAYTGQILIATATGAGYAASTALSLIRIGASSGAWNAASSLSYARKQGTLTTLLNGTVIAAGGINASSAALSSTELFDPAIQQWFLLPSMNSARSQFNAVALNNGNLLVIGGNGSAGTAIATAEIYSPSSGTWTTTGSMAHARAQQKSVLLPNGKVLVVGGNSSGALSSCELYNPNTGSWSSVASLHTARYLETLTVLNDGTVLAAGGTSGSSALSSAEVYSSTANAWTAVGSMTHARDNHAAALLNNGSVLVAGGANSSDLVYSEIYSSTATTWSNTGSMNAARTLHAIVVTGQGVPFAVGGENSTSGELSSVEYYDQQLKTWTYSSSLPGTLDYVRAVTLENGDLLAAGGQSTGQPVSSSTLYMPYLGALASASSNVQVDSSDVVGSINLAGAATGYWAVVVQNPDGRQGMLVPGIQVLLSTAPPVTTLLLDGVATTSTTPSIAFGVGIGLSATDVGSGVAETSYSIDGASSTVYSSSFTLAVGTYTLSYQSVDRAGNTESLHIDTITITAGPIVANGSGGGLGVGVDPFGTLWSVATTSGAVSLASFPGGIFAASSTLTGADPDYPWSVIYDTSGAAYAVGPAIGSNGADLVALYAASANGNAIISSRTYDSGYGNNNLVFAAVGNWIAGSVQTSGPISLSSAGARSYSLAIWSVSPSSGLIQLTTAYTRAGFDVGTGLALDGAGDLWVSGFSLSPTSVSSNVFDLAVWEFAPDGKTLLAGPLIEPGYLPEFDTSKIASIFLSNGNIAVSAPRADVSSGTTLGFVLLTSTGQVLAENSWQPNDGSAILPGALLQDSSGRLVVSGAFDYPSGTAAGIWRYNSAGTQTSSVQLDDGGVHGAGFDLSGNLWLSVDGSATPVLDAGEDSAAGSFVDVAPPRTTLDVGTPAVSSGTLVYATAATTFSLTAVDDRSLPPGDGLGVGVAAIELAIDTTTFSVYSGTFSLVAEGTHTIEFYGVDLDSNVEVAHSSAVAVDLTPPITTLQVLGSSESISGSAIVSTAAALALTAVDPLSHGVASGVAATWYVIDEDPFSPDCEGTALSTSAPNGTCANEAYAGPFNLSLGTHTVYYFSDDAVGNQETVNVASITVDSDVLPPRSSLTAAAPDLSSSTAVYVAAETTFTLTAIDDLQTVGDGLGTGVAYSEVIIDSQTYSLYTGPFAVSTEGAHIVQYYSVDLASNVEVEHSSSVLVDATSPVTQLHPTGPSGVDISGAIMVSSTTPIELIANDPISNGVASGVAQTFYVVDSNPFAAPCEATPFDSSAPNGTCANEVYDGTFNLALGTHTVYYFSEDAVGNQELVNIASVTAATDILPPRTTLSVSAPSFSTGTVTYASDSSTVSLASIDDRLVPGDGAGVGVAAVYAAVDTTTFTVYSGTFSLVAEGTHTVEFFGIDLDSNVEVAHSSMVVVDLTPPITSLQVAGFSTTSSGTVVVSTDNSITLPAVDPISNGVASGVAETYYVVDVNPFSSGCESTPFNSSAPNGTCANEAYDGAFTLAVGTHTVYYFSEDQVGNQETVNITSVTVSSDIQPPRTSISFGIPFYSTGTSLYVGEFAPVTLTAVDDLLVVGDGLGLGVADTYISIDSATFSVYSGTFSISTEGWHTLTFYSVDVASNAEVQHSSAVAVDLTPPITTLQLTGPSDPTSENGYTVSTTTIFSLSAVDPVSNGVASGVAETYYVIDTDPFSSGCDGIPLSTSAPNGTCANEAYDGGFSLSVGTHTIYYFSEDDTGNQEFENISTVTVSTGSLPDVTGISPSSGPIGTAFMITGTGFGAYSSTASLVTFNGTSAPIAIWLSTAVSGNIPGTLSSGTASVVLQSVTDGFVVQSTVPAFLVDVPYISTITPASGAVGTGVMIGGYGFGSYNGSATELLVAGSSASLSVWIDTEIVWTVPTSLSPSTVSVVVSLTPSGGSETSNSVSFDVTSGGGGGHAFGLFGGLAAGPVSLAAMPDWYFLGDMLLPAASGGTIHTPSGAALEVPSYAVAKNTQFTMARVNEIDEPSLAMSISQQKLTAAGQAVSLGPTNVALAHPVTLILPYDPTLVTSAQLGSLEIYYYDPNENIWNALPTTVQANSHILTAQTSHFSLYQPLMMAPLISGGGAFDVFGLRTSYAFPNPSNHGAAVDFRLETGLADSVELHVYNVTGRRVLSVSLGPVNFITDPTMGQQDSYDYVWDVGGVGSGVYTYVFVAHKSGEHDVIATGKAAVIK